MCLCRLRIILRRLGRACLFCNDPRGQAHFSRRFGRVQSQSDSAMRGTTALSAAVLLAAVALAVAEPRKGKDWGAIRAARKLGEAGGQVCESRRARASKHTSATCAGSALSHCILTKLSERRSRLVFPPPATRCRPSCQPGRAVNGMRATRWVDCSSPEAGDERFADRLCPTLCSNLAMYWAPANLSGYCWLAIARRVSSSCRQTSPPPSPMKDSPNGPASSAP